MEQLVMNSTAIESVMRFGDVSSEIPQRMNTTVDVL